MFVATLLSSDVETSLIDKDGVASLSVIVNVAVESLIAPADALLKVIVTVSLASSRESSVIATVNVFEVSPIKKKYVKKKSYDLIFANILLPNLIFLIKEFNYILDHKGVLIVSGILIDQKNYLINLYRKFKIYPVKISEEEKWITITFKKKNEKAHWI